jgi:hypothetical protein
MTEEVENLVAQAIAALRKLNEQYNHVAQTLVERTAELATVDAELAQRKEQLATVSVQLGVAHGELGRIRRILQGLRPTEEAA